MASGTCQVTSFLSNWVVQSVQNDIFH
jgi:hypothetical protein